MSITLVLKHHKDDKYICFEKPFKQYREKLEKLLSDCEYVCVTFEKPYKPRTTGEGSQNNLFWLLATAIANSTGSNISDVEDGLKEKAISKGYPYHINPVTHRPTGDSMKNINTVQMSYLIDTAYEEIAELGIILPPTVPRKNEQTVERSVERTVDTVDIF